MTAGEGAYEQAERAAERVRKLRQQLEQAERTEKAWRAGAEGEALVGAELAGLEPFGWRLLNDVHWPGRPKANLDHVLVGPGGVLVVDAKNWSGRIEVRNGTVYQNGYRRCQGSSGVLQQSAAVAAWLEPEHRRLVQGWLCMTGQPALNAVSTDGVKVLGLDALTAAVQALPEVLDSTTADAIFSYLTTLLSGPRSPSALTTADAAAAALARARGGSTAGTSGTTAVAGNRPPSPLHAAASAPSDDSSWTNRSGTNRIGTNRSGTNRSRTNRRKSAQQQGCLRLLLGLAMMFFAAGLLLNIADGWGNQRSNVPPPTTSVVPADVPAP